MDTINKSFTATFKQIESDGIFTGEFEALASTFGNVDRVGDVMAKSAFDNAITKAKESGRMPKLARQHNLDRLPAVMTDIYKTDEGLIIRGRFLDTQLGKDTRLEVLGGAIQDMSVGFILKDYEIEDGKRVIKDLDLIEVSFVTVPANPEAQIISAKGQKMTVREFEHTLKGAGFSNKESTTIASICNKAGYFDRDDQSSQKNRDDLEGLSELLEQRIKTLKGG